MAKPVKKRAYTSTVRREQAERTRARIVEAAGERFEADGYGRTSIKAIAEAAGVAADTVYAVFGSKARVLTAVIDARLAPGGGANLLERPDAVAIKDEPDQRRQVQLLARFVTTVLPAVGSAYEILRTASAVEPEMAAVHAEMDRYRLRNMTEVASWLAARGPLRVDAERAGELIWVVASPDVGRMLRETLGWSAEAHAAWLEDVLARSLLVDGPATARRDRGPSGRARARPAGS